MNDLSTLHLQANDALVRNLFQRVPKLLGGTGEVSQAAEALAGRAPVPTNAPGVADTPGHSECSQRPIA